MNESRRILKMSHITCINDLCHMCEWVTSHASLCHVIYVNESCRIHQWVVSYTWMRHLTYINASCHVYWCAISRTSMRSCYMYEWVMSHTWMCHVMYTNQSDVRKRRRISHWNLKLRFVSRIEHKRVMSYIWMSHHISLDIIVVNMNESRKYKWVITFCLT